MSIGHVIVNAEWEITWKEAVVAKFYNTLPAFISMDSEKPRKTSSTIACVVAEIPSWHLHQIHVKIIIAWASLQVMMYELHVS
jgi:hypothetical protein